MNKSLKIGLYYIILFISLAIYLKLKNNKKLLLNIKKSIAIIRTCK